LSVLFQVVEAPLRAGSISEVIFDPIRKNVHMFVNGLDVKRVLLDSMTANDIRPYIPQSLKQTYAMAAKRRSAGWMLSIDTCAPTAGLIAGQDTSSPGMKKSTFNFARVPVRVV